MEKIKIEKNLQNSRCKVFFIEGHMGDFYISQNLDLLKENAYNPNVFVEHIDNYEDVQIGLVFTEQLILTVKYPIGDRVDLLIDAFENTLRGIEGGNISIFSFDEKQNLNIDDVKKMIFLFDALKGRFSDSSQDEFYEFMTSTLFSIFKVYPDNGIQTIIDYSRKNDIGKVLSNFEITSSISTETPTPSVGVNTNADEVIGSEVSFTRVLESFLKQLIEKLSIQNNDEIETKVQEFVQNLFQSKPSNIEVTENEDTNIEDIVTTEEPVVDNIELVPDDENDNDAPEEYSIEAIRNEVSNKNKMPSERALELVKFLNSKWISELAPNINHKIGNLLFFKENMDKFKLNPNDDANAKVSKVIGGVVHLELLIKNLTEWSNPDSNWKLDTKRQIKKSQKKWRKEFKKFRKSIADSILPFIKNILNKNEEIDVVEDEDSIDLCIYNSKDVESIKSLHSNEHQIDENVSIESLDETNIYNTVSLESLKSESKTEEEFFEKILLSEIPNKEKVIEKGMSFNLFTNEPLHITEKIKRRVKVQANKHK